MLPMEAAWLVFTASLRLTFRRIGLLLTVNILWWLLSLPLGLAFLPSITLSFIYVALIARVTREGGNHKILGVILKVPFCGDRWFCLPILFRLYVPKKTAASAAVIVRSMRSRRVPAGASAAGSAAGAGAGDCCPDACSACGHC